MQVTKTDKSPTRLSLVISADQHDLTPIKNHVLQHFASKVRVPGFREGSAPPALVEKYVNRQSLIDEFIEHALNQLYSKVIEEQKIRPASKPEVRLKKIVPFTEMQFEAELDIIGSIKLADYKNLKLVRKNVEVSDEEVKNILKSLQQRQATRKTVSRAAKEGDELVIDFEGKDSKGQPVPGTKGEDYAVIIGSKNFIPGFEDELVGLKSGAEKNFTIKFPKDYGVKTLQDQPVSFTVKAKTVNEMSLPKLDDKFASQAGPFKKLTDLKKDVKAQLLAEKNVQAENQFQNDLIKKITEKSDLEIPKAMVDEHIIKAEEDEKRNLATRGQTWPEHLKDEGISEEEHRERQRPEAETKVKAGLVLSEIAEVEDVSITPEELQQRIGALKVQYQDPAMQAELDKPENQRQIAAQLMTEKTIARLSEYSPGSKK